MKEFIELSKAAQEQLLDELTYYALCKMRKLTWRGVRVARGGSPPRGYEADGVALEVLAEALSNNGEKWNRVIYPTVKDFLQSRIDSKISNLVNLDQNKHERSWPTETGSDGTVSNFEGAGSEPDPLQVTIDHEFLASFHAVAMKELAGDEFLVQLLECMEAEIVKPSDIAVTLSTKEKPISVKDANNAIKRLARRLDKLDTRTKPTKKGKP